MGLPLDGIRVIDLTQYQMGPYATAFLGDFGAEVIKVEPRETGDPGRTAGPWGPGGTSAYFEGNNRSKKSITIDARTEKGKEILYRLVANADIFAQNFRPGVAERLGLGYERLSAINPRIIYLTGSAFGLKGPLAEKPGFDGVGQAMSGILSTIWSPPPLAESVVGTAISDQTGAFMLALGAMVALFHRERTGQGQEVDVSLLGSTMALVGWTFQGYLTSGREPKVSRARITSLGITSSHRTKDGKSILLLLMGREKQVRGFRLMGLERFINDDRYATAEKLIENQESLLEAMDEVMKTRDREDWLKLFDQADIPAAPIYNLSEAAKQPQALANEYVVEIEHPQEGRFRVLGLPIKLHKTPGRVGIAPALGQHTEEVLLGICGYTREEIEQMKKEKII